MAHGDGGVEERADVGSAALPGGQDDCRGPAGRLAGRGDREAGERDQAANWRPVCTAALRGNCGGALRLPGGGAGRRHIRQAHHASLGRQPRRWHRAPSGAGVRDSFPGAASGYCFPHSGRTFCVEQWPQSCRKCFAKPPRFGPRGNALPGLSGKLSGLENRHRLHQAPTADRRDEPDPMVLRGGDCFSLS